MLAELDDRLGAAEQLYQSGLTDLNRLAAEIAAVQLEKVEGVEEGLLLNLGPSAEKVKYSKAAVVADNHFAVNQAGPRFERLNCCDSRREVPGPIVSIPGQHTDAAK